MQHVAHRADPDNLTDIHVGATGGADGQHPEARFNRELYRAYSQAQSSWAAQAAEDVEFVNNVHWTDAQIAELEERGQMAPTIPLIWQLVQQAVSMLTANDPGFRATAREDSDRRASNVASDLMQWMWQMSMGQQELKDGIRDYYQQGRGAMHAFIDPDADMGKGEVRFRSDDPKNVFPDPNATHPLWDDAAYILVRRILTAEQVRMRWPEVDLSGVKEHRGYAWSGTGRAHQQDQQLFPTDISNYVHKPYEVIERYQKVPRDFHRLVDPVTDQESVYDEQAYADRRADPAYLVRGPQGPVPIIREEEVERLNQLFDNLGDVIHERRSQPRIDPQTGQPVQMPTRFVAGPAEGDPQAVTGSTRDLTPTTVGALIDQGLVPQVPYTESRIKVTASIGDQLLFEPFELPTRHYPVVPILNGHTRTPYPMSDVRRVRDLQKMVNKTMSLILAHASNTTNQKVFYPEHAGIDVEHLESEWAKAGTGFFPYNPEMNQVTGSSTGGIVIAQPGALPSELYMNMDRQIALMERALGIFSLQQGDPADAPHTFKGTIQVDEFGMRRIKSKMDDIYFSLERLGQVAFDLAQHVYDRRKVIRLTRPNGSTIESFVLPQGMSEENLQLDREAYEKVGNVSGGRYDIIVASGSTLPSNRWALLAQYIEMYQLGIVDDIAVLKKSELPDAEEILQRTSMLKQAREAVQQQAETIKRLQGDLQSALRQETNAKQKAELEKFKRRLDEQASTADEIVSRFETEMRKEAEKQQALLQQERSLRRPQGDGGN